MSCCHLCESVRSRHLLWFFYLIAAKSCELTHRLSWLLWRIADAARLKESIGTAPWCHKLCSVYLCDLITLPTAPTLFISVWETFFTVMMKAIWLLGSVGCARVYFLPCCHAVWICSGQTSTVFSALCRSTRLIGIRFYSYFSWCTLPAECVSWRINSIAK